MLCRQFIQTLMAQFAATFKNEIARLARKELKFETSHLKSAVVSYRTEIAALKRRVADLERAVRKASKAVPAPDSAPVDGANLRFRAAGFAKHRQRLGLSAAECGRLVGVSQLTVYKWEKGESAPRKSHMPAIAAFRSLGKREARMRLDG